MARNRQTRHRPVVGTNRRRAIDMKTRADGDFLTSGTAIDLFRSNQVAGSAPRIAHIQVHITHRAEGQSDGATAPSKAALTSEEVPSEFQTSNAKEWRQAI